MNQLEAFLFIEMIMSCMPRAISMQRDRMNDLITTLVDGEMIIYEYHDEEIRNYLIYDVIKFMDKMLNGQSSNR